MWRFAFLLAAFFAAASSTLWSAAAFAHGGSDDPAGARHALPSGSAPAASGLAQASSASHCPADDNGLPCACGPDRCTNFAQPDLALLARSSPGMRDAQPRDVLPPAWGCRAIADRHPVGTVGSRAPPLSS